MFKSFCSIVLLLIIIPALSCNQRQEQHKAGTKNMFDLQKFMQKEWQRVSTGLNGFVRISGKADYTDTTALSRTAAKHYFDELAAAYPGKDNVSSYSADAVEDNVTGNLTIIYTALKKNSNPYQIELNLGADNNVKSVYVTYYNKNLLWQSSKKIFYSVDHYFQLISRKKILFFPESIYREKILFQLP